MDRHAVRVGEPRELLAYVPYRLGFHPEASVVLLSMRRAGAVHQPGLITRTDLTDLADPFGGPLVMGALAAHLRDDGAEWVLVVAYDDAGDWPRARAHVLDALGSFAWLSVWLVAGDGYRHDACADGCCPRPLSDLEATEVGAAMVLDGVAVLPRRADLAVRAAPPSPDRAAAWAAYTAEVLQPAPPWRRAALWDAALRRAPRQEPVPGADLGRLLASLTDRSVRDALLGRVLDPAPAVTTGAYLTTGAVAAVLHGGEPPARPEVTAAQDVLVQVAAHARPGTAAPALGALAFLAWWAGDGARADVVARQCLDVDPAHGLARVVLDAVEAGMPPLWAEVRG